ncbi:MAG: LicD family protein, partial [Methanobrevibacter sp.]|nr:LicD family protein [Methanobrevibacter sp.]
MDYELKPKTVYSNLHLLILKLMEFVRNVCKKYDLEFWLDAGNLLGAVRHDGFIPWDDDADLAMTRKDFFIF